MAKYITPPPISSQPIVDSLVPIYNDGENLPLPVTKPDKENPIYTTPVLEDFKEAVKYIPQPIEAIRQIIKPSPIEPIRRTQPIREDKSSPTRAYQYGIKQIHVGDTSYQNNGIFVTKPIEVEGNVMSVSLLSHEEHPLFDGLGGSATNRFTSIEYYVAYKENPTLQDWHPILPEGTLSIACERLFIKQNTATLRFRADLTQAIKVYRNGVKMNENEYYFLAQGKQIQINESNDPFAIYTIDYVPSKENQDPWTLQIDSGLSKRVRQIDTFPKGTDRNNTIALSRYPYVDFEKVQSIENYDPNGSEYRPFEIYLKDASIALGNGTNANLVLPKYLSEEEPFTVNRTDYKTRKDPILKPYSLPANYKQFEYKQYQNKVVFTEPFNRSNLYYNEANAHGNALIEVQYEYLITSFRLKMILRCNHQHNIGTPLLNDFSLQFRTMK